MAKQKEIIQTIIDERIATIPTIATHEASYDHTKLPGLPKITISTTPPEDPQINDIWIQTT